MRTGDRVTAEGVVQWDGMIKWGEISVIVPVLEPGDYVQWFTPKGLQYGTVIAVDGECAWLRNDAGIRVTVEIEKIQRRELPERPDDLDGFDDPDADTGPHEEAGDASR